ncbi:conserved exported protein of unknown function [Methylorubrum extorquens]|uniref:Uncharacterized protein n=1 Tax=Methylorubrum extorquens TaxID=408 RepID=A0A2N9AHH8_METEX|nr:conserved exported protein of unknown function [Methylorubrum extorquens]
MWPHGPHSMEQHMTKLITAALALALLTGSAMAQQNGGNAGNPSNAGGGNTSSAGGGGSGR